MAFYRLFCHFLLLIFKAVTVKKIELLFVTIVDSVLF